MLKRFMIFLCFISMMGFLQSTASAEDTTTPALTNNVLNGLKIALHARLQTLGIAEYLGRIEGRDDVRIYLFQKETHLGLDAKYGFVDFSMTAALSGLETASKSTANDLYFLQDFYADIHILPFLSLKVGQFVTPFSRERLDDEGNINFGDRSINNEFFCIGRDMGIAFHGNVGPLEAALGTFTGAGIGTPIRFLPQLFGIPMVMARIGYNTLDKSLFDLTPKDESATGIAAYINYMYEYDSRVGHGDVIGSKQTYYDQSLLLNPTWNNLQQSNSVYRRGTVQQIGVDFAFGTKLSDNVRFKASAEANYGIYQNTGYPSIYSNKTASIDYAGGVAEVGIEMGIFAFDLRYAVVLPDARAGYVSGAKTYFPMTSDLIHQITPALTANFKKSGLKVVADMQIDLNTPLAYDPTDNGDYDLVNQPDQFSLASKLLPGGKFARGNTVTARLMCQFQF